MPSVEEKREEKREEKKEKTLGFSYFFSLFFVRPLFLVLIVGGVALSAAALISDTVDELPLRPSLSRTHIAAAGRISAAHYGRRPAASPFIACRSLQSTESESQQWQQRGIN